MKKIFTNKYFLVLFFSSLVLYFVFADNFCDLEPGFYCSKLWTMISVFLYGLLLILGPESPIIFVLAAIITSIAYGLFGYYFQIEIKKLSQNNFKNYFLGNRKMPMLLLAIFISILLIILHGDDISYYIPHTFLALFVAYIMLNKNRICKLLTILYLTIFIFALIFFGQKAIYVVIFPYSLVLGNFGLIFYSLPAITSFLSIILNCVLIYYIALLFQKFFVKVNNGLINDELLAIAKDPKTPIDALEKLSVHENKIISEEAMKNIQNLKRTD